MLARWLLLGRVVFGKSTPEDTITAIIEFIRLADMCSVTGMESLMAEHIQSAGVINMGHAGWFALTKSWAL
jgi:hypothetical protein